MTIRLVGNDLRTFSSNQQDGRDEKDDKRYSCNYDDRQETRITLAFLRRRIVSSGLNLLLRCDGRYLGGFYRVGHTM